MMSVSDLKKYFKENLWLVLLFGAAALAECLIVFPMMTTESLNYDSSYQYALTQHTIPEIWELIPSDYSPPFYAITLKLFTIVFGNSLAVMRAFSLFAAVGMLWTAAFPVKNVFGTKTAYFSLIITFCSNTMLNQLHEIRPTIFAMFFFMALTVFALEAYSLDKKSAYICMTVFSVFAMYTHYIALVGAFGVYILVLALSLIEKKYMKFRNFLISGMVCAALYIPWLSVVLSQISNVKEYFWRSIYGFMDVLVWTFTDTFKTSGFNTLFSFTAIFVHIIIALAFLKHIDFKKLNKAEKIKDVFIKHEENDFYRNILFLLLCIVIPLIILQLINTFFSNLASSRYYDILGIVWIIFLSAVLGRLSGKICGIMALTLLLAGHIFSLCFINADVKKANISEMRTDICEYSQGRNISFLHLHEWSVGMMSYFFPDADHYVCDKTFTVLRSYDVFPTNIINIGDISNLPNYTDRCFIITNDMQFNNTKKVYKADTLLNDTGDYDISFFGNYTMSYDVVLKLFTIAEAVYTGDEADK